MLSRLREINLKEKVNQIAVNVENSKWVLNVEIEQLQRRGVHPDGREN
jgi:hypothetical protein